MRLTRTGTLSSRVQNIRLSMPVASGRNSGGSLGMLDNILSRAWNRVHRPGLDEIRRAKRHRHFRGGLVVRDPGPLRLRSACLQQERLSMLEVT